MDENSAYENYDLKPPRSGPDLVMIGVSLALVILLITAGYMTWLNNQAKAENQKLKTQIASLSQMMQEKQDDMQSLIVEHKTELQRVNEDWQTRLSKQQEDQDARLQKSYQTIAKIVNDSGSTMEYMRELETKMKSGKELHEQEIAELKAVAGGLAYLHQQYEKPLYEFKELEAYLAKQMQVQVEMPEERVKLFKQLFSKKYREENQADWAAYYRDRGRIGAVSAAREQVSSAYVRAQSQMSAVKLDSDKYLSALNEVVKNKEANTEVLESFFDVSAQILQIHKEVMDVKVDAPPRTGTTVSP